MSFLLRLCLGLFLLAPSLAYAASLETPGNEDKLSGLGFIRGWKCEAAGDITIKFNPDEDPDAVSIPALYGLPRGDTSTQCADDGRNGFSSFWNWGILGDGEHTAVAYDNGEEFARSTFTVATAGVPYLAGAPDTCITVDDFPSTGETTYLEWNESTQHFEMVESCATMPSGPVDHGECTVGLTVQPEGMCRGSVNIAGFGDTDYTFSVNASGQGCMDVGLLNRCFDLAEEFDNLLDTFDIDASIIKNADNSWTILKLPE